MREILASAFVLYFAMGNGAVAQQVVVPVIAAPVSTTTKLVAEVSKPPSPHTLQDGTAIKMRLADNLSSATAKTGQEVSFDVIEDVVLEGITIVPKGTKALATVTEASTKKSMGRGGKA